jgi:energy-coupling factor transporter ATP-binding protein EcfA2
MRAHHEVRPNRTPLHGQRIGLFGRGGSGKSTTTVFLAHALVKAGYLVCVLDADSTNEGLAQAVGAERAPHSLIEWLGGAVFSGGPVTCPVDDPVPLTGARVNLHELSTRFFSRARDGSLFFQAGKIGPLGPGAGCDGPMTKIARDFVLEFLDARVAGGFQSGHRRRLARRYDLTRLRTEEELVSIRRLGSEPYGRAAVVTSVPFTPMMGDTDMHAPSQFEAAESVPAGAADSTAPEKATPLT